MSQIINFTAPSLPSGITNNQFRQLDSLYLIASSHKKLSDRAVDCDFDEGRFTFTYFQAPGHPPYLQFVAMKVGPRTIMFELYKEGKGRITRSGIFEKVFERLQQEIESLTQ